MAGSLGKAAADIGSPVLRASVELQGYGGLFLFRITTRKVEVTKELVGVAVVGTVFVGLGTLWAQSRMAGACINTTLKKGFGDENNDQDIAEPTNGSLLVRIRCFTDQSFLEVLAGYESEATTRRLEKELEQVGFNVEELKLQLENMDEVNKKRAAIYERLEYRSVNIAQDMEKITDEEQKEAFQMGYTTGSLEVFLISIDQKPKFVHHLRMTYHKFLGTASRLGIHLQDPPPEETTTNAEMKTFINKQLNHVEECLVRRGNVHIHTLHAAGNKTSNLINILMLKVSDNPDKKRLKNEHIQGIAKQLKSLATMLGIDLSEELETAMNVKQLNEVFKIEEQIKKKIGRRKRSQKKRSEIDPTRVITDEDWTVSLVRLPDSSNSEHAFLVVEGISGNKSMIWFVDFVANEQSDVYRPGMRDGKVRVDFHEWNEVPGTSSKLLFQGRKKMMQIYNSDRLLFSTWQIPKFTAATLINNIQAQKASPPKYNILGNTKLAGSSATSSSMDTGHNCFTFARTMLRDLNAKYITIPEDTLDKWIVSSASRYLGEKQFNNKSWKTPTLTFVLALVFLAGVITAYIIPKLL